jgi:hypothetical protein
MTVTRLVQSVTGTSDSAGNISFTLGPAALGEVWEGSLQIPNIPTGANLTAKISSTLWGSWTGPTSFGPIQLWNGESVIVTGTGAAASTQYTLVMNGIWRADDGTVLPIGPSAPMATVPVEPLLTLVSNADFSSGAINFTAPRYCRRVQFLITGYPTPVTRTLFVIIQGLNSAAIYYSQTLPNVSATSIGTAPNDYLDWAYLEPDLELGPAPGAFNISASTISPSARITVVGSMTNPAVKIQNPSGQPVPVTIVTNTPANPLFTAAEEAINAYASQIPNNNTLTLIAADIANFTRLGTLTVNNPTATGCQWALLDGLGGFIASGFTPATQCTVVPLWPLKLAKNAGPVQIQNFNVATIRATLTFGKTAT